VYASLAIPHHGQTRDGPSTQVRRRWSDITIKVGLTEQNWESNQR